MPVADAVLLIGALTGVIGAVGLIVTPITVAVINVRAKKAPPVEQGQPADDPVLTAERDRRQLAERERDAFRSALRRANDLLAAHKLPLQHPDL